MDISNLQPGCTQADIEGPPQVCDKCGLAGDELYGPEGVDLCQGCYENWKEEKWFEHYDRLQAVAASLLRTGTFPDWYDPDSFEGRLLELEEEVK